MTRELENEGLLDPEVEFLPNKSELSRRAVAKEGMTKQSYPLLSYSKMSLDADLADSSFTKDEYLNRICIIISRK